MYMYHSENNLNSRQIATIATTTSKWVRNMFSTPLTEDQKQLLAHGQNFTISAKSPPIGEYSTSVGQTCLSLSQERHRNCMQR